MLAKPLPDAALDQVSLHGHTHLLAHCNAQNRAGPIHSALLFRHDHDEVSRRPPYAPLRDPAEVFGHPQPLGTLQPGRTPIHRYLEGTETARRLRPFALRRLMIARPPAVRMRARKP